MIDPDAPIVRLETIDSTNLEARRRLEGGEQRPFWAIADLQTGGRGRRGRTWSSLSGNLHATYGARCDLELADLAPLGLVAGVALADAISSVAPKSRLRLKWPNDLLLDEGKVAGVLIEAGRVAGGTWFALGIGLNVAAAPPPSDTGYRAAALADHGVRLDRDGAFALVAAALWKWSRLWRDEGFDPIRAAWLAWGPEPGAEIVVNAPPGVLRGGFAGLRDDGALLIRASDGAEHAVMAGDVLESGSARE